MIPKNLLLHPHRIQRHLSLQVAEIAKDTVTIRSLDYDRDRFDIEFGYAISLPLPYFQHLVLHLAICLLTATSGCRLQNGTTYNSFLIFGEEKTALVDASHEKFRELYIDTLKAQLAAAGRKIDYIFVSHTEPDHSGECAAATAGQETSAPERKLRCPQGA